MDSCVEHLQVLAGSLALKPQSGFGVCASRSLFHPSWFAKVVCDLTQSAEPPYT